MNDRDRAILRLALANLERSIRTLPTKTVRSWRPPLTIGEVARLRRRITDDEVRLREVMP